ncbi:hypothetical protein JKF63_02514 [Porcisia hertigi]|uniref:Uncharacterized protein n=1 Tax=Porcisia hertigi TaxID=2761500 RepID=A0A836IJV4_9TRYP|nr:hypothetical protein JKF63_02514 [Porcisia hertigi]
MSLPEGSSMMTCFGLLQEEGREKSIKAAERITHWIPILEGLPGQDVTGATENSAVIDLVERLRDAGGTDSPQVQKIRWRGETAQSIREQLQPMVRHYKSQILFVQERTRRRALESEEVNERVPLVTDYYRSTPLIWRLQGYMSNSESRAQGESDSVLGTSGSTAITALEARRERQFQETFQRFANVLGDHGIDSRRSSFDNRENVNPTHQADNGMFFPPSASALSGFLD